METILVISDNPNGFVYNAICSELEKNNINITKSGFEDEQMAEKMLDSEIIFAMLSDNFDSNSIFFNSFKKKCIEWEKKIILYAEANKIAELKGVFANENIIDTLVRPMENDEIVERLMKYLNKVDNQATEKHILVVDDSGPMLRTIMGWLEGKYKVSLANSAATALTSIGKEKPDLILLDYEMPVCSGPQFLEMLRTDEETKDIPVFFLTAQSDSDLVKSVLGLKPQGYILKTTPVAKVLEKIELYFG